MSVCCLCFQTSEPSEPLTRQDSQTAAHTQSSSRSGSHSRATHSHTYRNHSTSSSSSHHQTQTQSLPQQAPHVQGQTQASDGGVPPDLASTLEHIIGQLDILTQVSKDVLSSVTNIMHCTLTDCASHSHCSEQTLPSLVSLGGRDAFSSTDKNTQKHHLFHAALDQHTNFL